MKLVIGLGNPGAQYEQTRHNLGFMALDLLLGGEGNFGEWHESKKLGALVAKGVIAKEGVMLIKPTEFYNQTGPVLQKIMAYYKANSEDIIVIHDDLDLKLGQLRITKSSSAAGNNGVQSIIDTLKTQNFRRVRVGVATDAREQIDAQDFVLMKFTAAEKKLLSPILDKMPLIIHDLIKNHPSIESAQNKYHGG